MLRKLLGNNPFAVLNQVGEGRLMKIAVGKSRAIKPDFIIGICEEHGGEPSFIYFCYKIGLDYVSCSPYRIPIARLAVGQAAVRKEEQVK